MRGDSYGKGNARITSARSEERRPHESAQRRDPPISRTQGRPNAGSRALAWISTHPGRSLLIFLVAVAGVRIGLAATYAGYLGVDTGAYLLGVNEVWGGEPTGTSFTRPPLAPGFFMVPFLWAFPGYLGANLYAAVFSMSIFPSFYLLAQRLLGSRWGALATVGLALDWPLAEMFVTGVVPITGFAALALVVWGMMGLSSKNPKFRYASAIALGIPLIAFTNQTTLGLAFVTVPLAWLVLPGKRRVAIALVLGAVLALSALPWYLDVLPGSARVSYPGPLIYLNPWWSSQWIQGVYGILAGALVLRLRPVVGMRLLAILLIVHATLNVFLSNDEALMNIFYRSSYWMAVPVWICFAYLVRHYLNLWRPAASHVALACACLLSIFVAAVQDQV